MYKGSRSQRHQWCTFSLGSRALTLTDMMLTYFLCKVKHGFLIMFEAKISKARASLEEERWQMAEKHSLTHESLSASCNLINTLLLHYTSFIY